MVDAGGATVIPGFVEGHMHLFAGAAELDHLQLFGTRGFDELKARIEAYVRANPGRRPASSASRRTTSSSASDEPLSPATTSTGIVKDRPILVFSPDHHTAWANTIALETGGHPQGPQARPRQ